MTRIKTDKTRIKKTRIKKMRIKKTRIKKIRIMIPISSTNTPTNPSIVWIPS